MCVRVFSHRSGPVFVEPARSFPAVSLLEHAALLRQHLKQASHTQTQENTRGQTVTERKRADRFCYLAITSRNVDVFFN